MIQGTVGTLLHHANKKDAMEQTEFVLVESNGTERTDRFRERIEAGESAYNVIEVGTDLEGNAVDKHYCINFVSNAFSIADKCRGMYIDAFIDPKTTVIHTNQGETGFKNNAGDNIEQWPQPSLQANVITGLYNRYKQSDGAPITLVFWELIEDNGIKMKENLVAMAEKMKLDDDFIIWLKSDAVWCPCNVQNQICVKALNKPHTVANNGEPFVGVEPPAMYAFSIQRHPDNPARNPFPEGLPGLTYFDTAEEVAQVFRTKNRLLNALHVMMVARKIAQMPSYEKVIQAMRADGVKEWLMALGKEIIELNGDKLINAEAFLADVIRRFENDWLAHSLLDICKGIPGKWPVRVVPTIDMITDPERFPKLTQVHTWHNTNMDKGLYNPYQ